MLTSAVSRDFRPSRSGQPRSPKYTRGVPPGGDEAGEFGRYRIASELGRGGMGVVYRASDTLLRREVALKVLHRVLEPASLGAASLLGEARAAAAIGHPNAVAVYDVGDLDGVPYIAMELVEGRSLRICAGDGSISADTRVRWLIDVARALSAAHARGVIHRDVKPENILVRDDGVVKVLDFGIARQLHSPSEQGGAWLPPAGGSLVGTPAYMAPEQIRGEPVDAAVDQFAWGVVAYELLAGGRPWGVRDSGLRAIAQVAWVVPPHVCDGNAAVARRFGDVVMRALSRDRSDRFSSMSDLLAALEPQQGPGVLAVPAARSDAAPSRVGKRDDTTTETSTPERPVRLDTASPAAHKARADLPERIGGKYLPIRLLATGVASAVYEVEHLHTGEHLALKLMNPRAWRDPMSLARFKREARVSAQVKSDHVVRVIDADVATEVADAPFLVMELLQGQTLEELTAGYGQSSALVLNWIRQVTRGVERLHALGIVHRDLRPANLFRVHGPDEAVAIKILDFRASKTLGPIDDQNTTTAGTIVGSPPYLSPEQASGDSAGVGPEADIWALGMTTYRLLAGRDYWAGSDVATLLSLVLFGAIEPPSARGLALGKPFDQWFLRSCARDPDRRFPCVDDQMRALESALGAIRAPASEPEETNDSLASLALGPPSIPPRPEVSSRSMRSTESPWRARVAMAVVLVAVAFLGHWASPGEAPRVVPRQTTRLVAPTTAAAPPSTTSGGTPPAASIDPAPSSAPQARAASTSLSGAQEAHRRRSSPPVHVAPMDPYAGPD